MYLYLLLLYITIYYYICDLCVTQRHNTSPIFCFPPRCLDHREGFALARHGQVAYAVRPVKRPFAADYSRTSRGGAWSWDLGFAAAQPTLVAERGSVAFGPLWALLGGHHRRPGLALWRLHLRLPQATLVTLCGITTSPCSPTSPRTIRNGGSASSFTRKRWICRRKAKRPRSTY